MMTAASFLRLSTVAIIKYWSLAFVPLAILLFIIPARLKVRAQAIWIMVLLACGMKGLVFETLGGNAMAPDLPEILVWLWNWADDGLFFLVLFSAVWWVRRGRTVLLPILAWSVAAWGQYNGTVVPDVHEIALEYPGLPPSLDGYRIVQISDLHCSSASRRWRTQAIVDRANGLDADLICLTGDYVDGSMDALADDMLPLTGLKARDGVYAVRGNHEYYVDKCVWRDWYGQVGLRMLVNECVFPRPGLAVGGVNDDPSACKYGDVPADVGQAFAAATNGEFRILLAHRPRRAREYFAASRFNLQLSGHTHGGIMPILSWLVAWHNAGYVRGKYELSGPNHLLYVSPGAGQWAGFPVRFFDPAEITLITLRK